MRSEGNSLTEIAEATGTTTGVVRRIVGPIDRTAAAHQREEVARRIDGLSLSWNEKVQQWIDETGQSGTTFWRVLQRHKQKPRHNPTVDN
jgi:hypothetical protein